MQQRVEILAQLQGMLASNPDLHGSLVGIGVGLPKDVGAVAQVVNPLVNHLAVLLRIAAREVHVVWLEGRSIDPHRGQALHPADFKQFTGDGVLVSQVEDLVDMV